MNSTYSNFDQYLGDRGNRPVPASCGSPRSTRIVRVWRDAIAVRYHDTNVVTLFPSGHVMLNSGGYESVTTKARMNRFAQHVNVFQKSFEWFVSADGHTVPFFDRVLIGPEGAFCNPLSLDSQMLTAWLSAMGACSTGLIATEGLSAAQALARVTRADLEWLARRTLTPRNQARVMAVTHRYATAWNAHNAGPSLALSGDTVVSMVEMRLMYARCLTEQYTG